MSKKDGSHDKSKNEKSGKKKNTSLRLEGKMLKALKILAIQEDTSVQRIIEELVSAHLAAKGVSLGGDGESDH